MSGFLLSLIRQRRIQLTKSTCFTASAQAKTAKMMVAVVSMEYVTGLQGSVSVTNIVQ